jgi:tetratricopeptide (TPR) repeat protein
METRRTFAILFLAMAGLFALDTFLAKLEKSDSRAEARRLFAEGERLAREGRNLEAIDRFRGALSIEREERDYQLALADALLAAGKFTAAETIANDLLQHDSTSGAANLTMARVQVKLGKIADATSYYHRAIYGQWKRHATEQRVRARLELVDLLASQNAKEELLAELLPLQAEPGIGIDIRKRIARLYMAAGSPSRTADMFREILRTQPQDPDAHAGLGEAQFATGDYREARTNFQAAVKLQPGNAEIQKLLEQSNQILVLDPTQRGLGSGERYRRSVKLVELALLSRSQTISWTIV